MTLAPGTTLLRAYQQLMPRAQRLLQILAVAYGTIDVSPLPACMQAAGFPVTLPDAQSLLRYLQSDNLVVEMAGGWQCHPSLAHEVLKDVAEKNLLAHLGSSVQQRVGAWCYRVDAEWSVAVRNFRLALYAGDTRTAMQRLGHCEESAVARARDEDPLALACNRPYDREWLLSRPNNMPAIALWSILRHSDQTLYPAREAFELFVERANPAHENDRITLAEHYVLRGALDKARGVLATPAATSEKRSWPQHSVAGRLAFVAGDDEAALRHFEAGLAGLREETGRRKVCFTDLDGLFYMLTLLRQRRLDDVAAHCALVKKERYSPIRSAALMLEEVVAFVRGGTRALLPPEDLFKPGQHACTGLVYFLSRYWLSPASLPELVPAIQQFIHRARTADYVVWAEQAEQLLHRHEGKPAAGWIDILGREAEWKRVLRGLTALSESNQPVGETRLTWWITDVGTHLDLEAREQKRDARGWSKGRRVPWRQLATQTSKFECLTEQDLRLITCIEPDPLGEQYDLDVDRALSLLAGHPLVYSSNLGGASVEMRRAHPEVVVQQTSGGLELSMNPMPDGGASFRLVKETETRFKVVEFTPAQRQMARLLEQAVLVPAEAAAEVTQLMSSLSSLVTIHSDVEVGTAAREVECDTRVQAFLYPYEGGLKIQLGCKPLGVDGPLFRLGHGGATVVAEVAGERVQTRRHLEAERAARKALVEACPSLLPQPTDEWVFPDLEDCLQLLLELGPLEGSVVVHWPQGRPFKMVGRVASDRLDVRIERSRDWFSLHGEVHIDETRVLGMRELLRLMRERPGRFVALGNNEFLALTDEFRKRLTAFDTLGEEHRGQLRFHSLAAATFDTWTQGVGRLEADDAWTKQLARWRQATDTRPQLPSTLQAELRSYQREGFEWLSRLASWGVGACLADDMGLGKTVQALAVLLERAPKGPTLVVAPASVGMNWVLEAARFAPTLNVQLMREGNRAQRMAALAPFDVVVCTYGLLHTESELLASVEWQTVVLDEAQAIKNRGTRRSQAAKLLRSGFRMVTTGTPVENHLGELWNLFDFLNPGLLGTLESYNRRFASPIEKDSPQAAQLRLALRNLISPFILRRTKTQVLTELPPRTDITLHVELSAAEMALYEALRQEAVQRLKQLGEGGGERHIHILAELMKLRRVCCHPALVAPDRELPSSKLAALADMVDELLDNRHKALVFSQFVDHLTLVREHLDAKGIRYQYLDGSTPIPERARRVEAFQGGDGDLFLISLKAGGTGLNLTAADYVIHLDPWWNPAVEDQASDRAYRIGQTRPVTIYRLVARGTIEEQIVALHRDKRELADSLLSGTDMSARLSSDDLLRLLEQTAGP